MLGGIRLATWANAALSKYFFKGMTAPAGVLGFILSLSFAAATCVFLVVEPMASRSLAGEQRSFTIVHDDPVGSRSGKPR